MKNIYPDYITFIGQESSIKDLSLYLIKNGYHPSIHKPNTRQFPIYPKNKLISDYSISVLPEEYISTNLQLVGAIYCREKGYEDVICCDDNIDFLPATEYADMFGSLINRNKSKDMLP